MGQLKKNNLKGNTMKTSEIIAQVYASVGKTTRNTTSFFAEIAKDEIQKIFEAQKTNNLDYTTPGFKSTNITSATVQKQIAKLY